MVSCLGTCKGTNVCGRTMHHFYSYVSVLSVALWYDQDYGRECSYHASSSPLERLGCAPVSSASFSTSEDARTAHNLLLWKECSCVGSFHKSKDAHTSTSLLFWTFFFSRLELVQELVRRVAIVPRSSSLLELQNFMKNYVLPPLVM